MVECRFIALFLLFSCALLTLSVSARELPKDVLDKSESAVMRVGNCKAIQLPPKIRNQHAQRRALCQVIQHPRDPNQPVYAGHGTAFLINKEGYLATNWHVVQNAYDLVVFDGGHSPAHQRQAKVVWTSKVHDVVILKVEGLNPNRTPMVLSQPAKNSINKSADVWSMGYPGGSEEAIAVLPVDPRPAHGSLAAINDPRILEPKIDPKAITNTLDHTARVNPGNSGGPLIDACGRAIAINQSKVVDATVDATYFSVDISYLIQGLKQKNIDYTLDNSPCTSPVAAPVIVKSTVKPEILIAIVVLLVVICLMIAWLMMRKQKRPDGLSGMIRDELKKQGRRGHQTSQHRVSPKGSPATPGPTPAGPNKPSALGYLIGYNKLAHLTITLGPENMTLGRGSQADVLIEADIIGRVHARISVTPEGMLVVQDLDSVNGTFRVNGERMVSNQVVKLRPGEQFYLAHPDYALRFVPPHS